MLLLSVFTFLSPSVEAASTSELKDQCNRLAKQVNNIKDKKKKKELQKVVEANCKGYGSGTAKKLDRVSAALKKAGGTTTAAAKKKYNEECKTAAAKKKPKCTELAKAAGITASKPSPAGTAINKCGDVDTAFNYGCSGVDSGKSDNSNPIFQVLFFIVNIVALGVGMAAVGGVIYGAILYTSAGDNGEQTKKGINVVVNAVLGVVLFAFMYAILNFLVPGGLFTG